MNTIRIAEKPDVQAVYDLTHDTIEAVYPCYYPRGVVDFFHEDHSWEGIAGDVAAGNVYILFDGAHPVSTGSIHEGNEVGRLFVHTKRQGQGYGSVLMEYLEGVIAETQTTARLDASLPALAFYQHRGYHIVSSDTHHLPGGECLCFFSMEKHVAMFPSRIQYDGRIFTSTFNVEHGEVSSGTYFYYRQQGAVVWAEYKGGGIARGFLVGTVDIGGNLTFTYQHVNMRGETRLGKCCSRPEVLPDGRIRLHESWQWLDGDQQTGTSVIEELQP